LLEIMAAEDVVATGADPSELESGGLLHEIFTSPLNLLLLGLCIFLLYKIVRGDQPGAGSDSDDDEPPPLPRLKRRDFTPAELRRFDGVQDPRILMAINGKVFDVTKGRKFYGPGRAAGEGILETKEGAPAWEMRRRAGRPQGEEGVPRAGKGGLAKESRAVLAGRLPPAKQGTRDSLEGLRVSGGRRSPASAGTGCRKKAEALNPGWVGTARLDGQECRVLGEFPKAVGLGGSWKGGGWCWV
jgi:hypothetical protein